MANYLSDLATGLRGAAGILNPQIQKQQMEDDRQNQLISAQQQQFLFSQLAKQVEGGTLTAAQASQAAQARGIQVDPNLFGGPSIETQAKQQTLANEKGFREDVTAAAGDMTKIAAAAVARGKPEVAVSIYNQAEARTARLQEARDRLEARQSELQMRMDDRQATREQQAAAQQAMLELRRQGLSLQSEIARGNQELKRMQIELGGGQKADKNVQQLGTALEKAGIPNMAAVVRDAESELSKPGMTEWVTGPKSMVPDMMAPESARIARQSVQKLFNITLKDRSGAAVTNQELERLKAEFGSGVFKTPEQLNNAIVKAKTIIDAHYKGVAAGFGKDALDKYNANLTEMGGSPLDFSAKPAAPASNGWGIKEMK